MLSAVSALWGGRGRPGGGGLLSQRTGRRGWRRCGSGSRGLRRRGGRGRVLRRRLGAGLRALPDGLLRLRRRRRGGQFGGDRIWLQRRRWAGVGDDLEG